MGLNRGAFSMLLLSAGITSVAPAQQHAEFGILAGATFSKFRGSDKGALDQSKLGIAGGGFVTLVLTPEFGFQPEVLFVQKGGKGPANTDSYRFSYIQIPVLAKFRLPPSGYANQLSPHLYVGAAVGLKVGCHATVSSVSGSCKELGVQIKRHDFSVVAGAGLNFGRAFIDARFDLGFTKIEDAASPDDVRNSTLYLLAGWTFRLPG
jgi:hypothetical protein